MNYNAVRIDANLMFVQYHNIKMLKIKAEFKQIESY